MNGIKWTEWSKPYVLKTYKYKGFIIEYWEQCCSSPCSTIYHHEFVGFKDGKRVTSEKNQHHRYTECVHELNEILGLNYG